MTGESADAVVVGGGIVGVSTALQLQRTGRTVMLIERGTPGNEASGHNGGMFSDDCLPTGLPDVILKLPQLLLDPESPLVIRLRYLPRLAPWMIRFALNSRPSRVEAISTALYSLMKRGVEAYRPLIAGTEAESILHNRGHLYAYRHGEALNPNSFVFGLRQRRGVTYQIVDDAAMSKLSPLFAGRFETGVYFPKAHWTKDPRAFTQTLLASFLDKGGPIQHAEVRGFETTASQVTGVRTDNSVVKAGAVVIAAGPWSRGLLRHLGTEVPLDVERGYGADLPAPGMQLDVPVILADVHSALTPHKNGVRLAGYDELASVSAPADPKLPQRLIRSARKVFPELCAEGGTFWMRRRPSTPDSLPVIGRAPRFENAYLAFGHGHKGLCMAAITGKLVQELMDGVSTTVDVTPFRPTRFHVVAGVL
jgi:glycine/D-amino acid oxidase-like deaminating enzyme